MTLLNSAILELALKSTVVLLAGFAVTTLLKTRSAALRHLVWCLTFCGLLAMPLLRSAVPGLPLRVFKARVNSTFLFQVDSHDSGVGNTGTRNAPRYLDLDNLARPTWLYLAPAVAAIGSALSLTQILFGCFVLSRRRRRAQRLFSSELAGLASQLRLKTSVELLEADAGAMPMTYGVLRPAIFLPLDAESWTAARRRAVLLHELAHVKRADTTTHLLARIAVSLYWWNPLAWFAWLQFLKEREVAADDVVLNLGTSSSAYAEDLLETARSLQSPNLSVWPVVAMASRSQLESRLEAILDSRRNRRAPDRLATLTISVIALALLAPFAAIKAQANTAAFQTGDASLTASQAGDSARDSKDYATAKRDYTEALNLSTNISETAAALIRRGTVELATHDVGDATADFQQAQTADPGKADEARMWMAIAAQDEEDYQNAATLYKSALDATDHQLPLAATILELYANMLEKQDDARGASDLRKQASEIRSSQPSQPVSSTYSSAQVYRAGKDVRPPALVSKIEPSYTEVARVAKYSGTALISVVVGADGIPQDVRVLRGLGFGLDEKAVEAVQLWRFTPGLKDGVAVPVRATIEVNFRLL